MKYFKKLRFFKNSMKEFKKEVIIKDSFIEDMNYFRGHVTFEKHNLVIFDEEKVLTKTEIQIGRASCRERVYVLV